MMRFSCITYLCQFVVNIPELGSLLRKETGQIVMDQMFTGSFGQHVSEGNVGYCGVRLNWPRKLGTTK